MPIEQPPQIKLGTLLAKIGRELQLTDEEFALFESIRDKSDPAAYVIDFGDDSSDEDEG